MLVSLQSVRRVQLQQSRVAPVENRGGARESGHTPSAAVETSWSSPSWAKVREGNGDATELTASPDHTSQSAPVQSLLAEETRGSNQSVCLVFLRVRRLCGQMPLSSDDPRSAVSCRSTCIGRRPGWRPPGGTAGQVWRRFGTGSPTAAKGRGEQARRVCCNRTALVGILHVYAISGVAHVGTKTGWSRTGRHT
jgi:hypothetical protein